MTIEEFAFWIVAGLGGIAVGSVHSSRRSLMSKPAIEPTKDRAARVPLMWRDSNVSTHADPYTEDPPHFEVQERRPFDDEPPHYLAFVLVRRTYLIDQSTASLITPVLNPSERDGRFWYRSEAENAARAHCEALAKAMAEVKGER